MEVLTALAILAVISVTLARILQGALRIHELQTAEPARLREREALLARQFAGELEEPVLTLKEIPDE